MGSMTGDAQPTTPSSSADALRRAGFRDVFRGHPAGVTIITAFVNGEPVGITASSVSSLSLDPLSVSFSLMKRDGSAGKLVHADTMLIHFLAEDQADVAESFASFNTNRFSPRQGWTTGPSGEPWLTGCRAVFRVQPVLSARVGEATLFAAEVLSTEVDADKAPLVYMQHEYYGVQNLTPAQG